MLRLVLVCLFAVAGLTADVSAKGPSIWQRPLIASARTAVLQPEIYRVTPDYRGPVPPRIDVIGPLGNRLPPAPIRANNRPTELGGAITNAIAPSSREALSWQRSNALGLYENDGIDARLRHQYCPPGRVEQHYFYPKPWEVLPTAARPSQSIDYDDSEFDDDYADELESSEEIQAPPEEVDEDLPVPMTDGDGIDDPRSEPDDLLPELDFVD